jgi:hypothetical protein
VGVQRKGDITRALGIKIYGRFSLGVPISSAVVAVSAAKLGQL